MVARIRAATSADVPTIAAVLSDALRDDVVFAQLTPAQQNTSECSKKFFTAYATTHLGADRALDVACDEIGTVIGVAAWTYRPSGRSSLLTRQTKLSLRYLRSLGLVPLLRAVRLRQAIERRRPHGTHWWLSAVAVTAAHRDAGIGSALIRHRLTLLDQAAEAAYVESSTPADRAFFARLGFHAHETPGTPLPGEARSMTREPSRPIRRPD